MTFAHPGRCAHPARAHSSAGFSMLEMLVTLLIISVWLLGSAGVQTIAMKLNKTSQLRNQAVLLASEIGERIENNKKGAQTGAYAYDGSVIAAAGTNCLTVACTPAQLAQFDLFEISKRSIAALPGSVITIERVVETDPALIDPNLVQYSIIVTWDDRRGGQTYKDSGTVEKSRYTASKTFYKDV